MEGYPEENSAVNHVTSTCSGVYDGVARTHTVYHSNPTSLLVRTEFSHVPALKCLKALFDVKGSGRKGFELGTCPLFGIEPLTQEGLRPLGTNPAHEI